MASLLYCSPCGYCSSNYCNSLNFRESDQAKSKELIPKIIEKNRINNFSDSNRVKSQIDTTKIILHFGCTKIFSPTLCNFVCGFLFVIMCDLCLWLCVWICLCDWQAHDTSSSVFLFLPILCRCWTYPIIWTLTFLIIWTLTFLILCHISSFKVRKKKVLLYNFGESGPILKKPMTKNKRT